MHSKNKPQTTQSLPSNYCEQISPNAIQKAINYRERAFKLLQRQDYFEILTICQRCSKLLNSQLQSLYSENDPTKKILSRHQTSIIEQTILNQEKFQETDSYKIKLTGKKSHNQIGLLLQLDNLHDNLLQKLKQKSKIGYFVILDCFLLSSIAYIQLHQYDQAISLLDMLIEVEQDAIHDNESNQLNQFPITPENASLLSALLIRVKAKQLLKSYSNLEIIQDLKLALFLSPDDSFILSEIQMYKNFYDLESVQIEIFNEKNFSKSYNQQKLYINDQSQRSKSSNVELQNSLVKSVRFNLIQNNENITCMKFEENLFEKEKENYFQEEEYAPKENEKKKEQKNEKKQLSTKCQKLHPRSPSLICFDFEDESEKGSTEKTSDLKGAEQVKTTWQYLSECLKYSLRDLLIEKMANEIKQGKSDSSTQLSPKQRKEMDHVAFYKQIQLIASQILSFIKSDQKIQAFISIFLIIYAYFAYRMLKFARWYFYLPNSQVQLGDNGKRILKYDQNNLVSNLKFYAILLFDRFTLQKFKYL